MDAMITIKELASKSDANRTSALPLRLPLSPPPPTLSPPNLPLHPPSTVHTCGSLVMLHADAGASRPLAVTLFIKEENGKGQIFLRECRRFLQPWKTRWPKMSTGLPFLGQYFYRSCGCVVFGVGRMFLQVCTGVFVCLCVCGPCLSHYWSVRASFIVCCCKHFSRQVNYLEFEVF